MDIANLSIHKSNVDLSTHKLSVQGPLAVINNDKILILNGADIDNNVSMELFVCKKPTLNGQ